MRTFINQFNAAYNAISKKQFMIPESTKSLILVQKASISNVLERLVLHKIDFTKNYCYDEVSKSLIRIMGDTKKINYGIEDGVCVTEKVEGVSKVKAAANGRWNRKSNGK